MSHTNWFSRLYVQGCVNEVKGVQFSSVYVHCITVIFKAYMACVLHDFACITRCLFDAET